MEFALWFFCIFLGFACMGWWSILVMIIAVVLTALFEHRFTQWLAKAYDKACEKLDNFLRRKGLS